MRALLLTSKNKKLTHSHMCECMQGNMKHYIIERVSMRHLLLVHYVFGKRKRTKTGEIEITADIFCEYSLCAHAYVTYNCAYSETVP